MPVGVDPAKHRIPVPDGLRSLLESLAREVLRGQPSDIYEFSALFFEKLNEFRQRYGVNPIDGTSDLYDRFKLELFTEAANKQLVSSKLLLLSSSSTKGLNSDDSKLKTKQEGSSATTRKNEHRITDPNEAATKIQATARGFLDRRRVAHNKEVLLAARDERIIEPDAYSPKRKPRKGKKKRPKTANSNEPKIVVEEKDVDQAATKIQAGIRGYLTRKKYVELKHKRDHAATKIQAGIKGHLTRKHLQAKGIPVHRVTRSPSPNVHASQSLLEEVHEEPRSNETEIAASKIQAGVRGYLTRKHMEEKGLHVVHPKRSGSKSPSPGQMLTDPFENQVQNVAQPAAEVVGGNADEAASKIQAGIRGYLTRKHLNEKGIPVHAPAHHHREQKSKSPSPKETSPQHRTSSLSKIPKGRGRVNQKTKLGSPGAE